MKKQILLITLALVTLALTTVAQDTGSFIDSREVKSYKTVKIGMQTWMAENLNYFLDNTSICYKDSSICNKYGKLYTYETANRVCPSGWHLPNNKEWQTLIDLAGGKGTAGKNLKSISIWSTRLLNDKFNFNALPGGCRFGHGPYKDIGFFGYWCSSDSNNNGASSWYINNNYDGIFNDELTNVDSGLSVRCLNDTLK
jgi:uncharacterized protein (TIGR02145 family)